MAKSKRGFFRMLGKALHDQVQAQADAWYDISFIGPSHDPDAGIITVSGDSDCAGSEAEVSVLCEMCESNGKQIRAAAERQLPYFESGVRKVTMLCKMCADIAEEIAHKQHGIKFVTEPLP